MRSLVAIGAAVTLAAGMVGCASSEPAESTEAGSTKAVSNDKGPVIGLSSLTFMPAKTTIKVGTTLTWRNDETISHTVTSGAVTDVDAKTGLRGGEESDGTFDEQLPKKGDTFSFTFDKAGTYPYFCDIHKGMNAEVVVTP